MSSGLDAARLIFQEELSTHLNFLTAASRKFDADILERGELPTDEWLTLRRSIENRFHVLKGGAGFFQYDRIRDTCDRGEKYFASSTEDQKTAGSELRLLIDELQREEKQLLAAKSE
jgi:chemotaxis protein histidine kinase CheA